MTSTNFLPLNHCEDPKIVIFYFPYGGGNESSFVPIVSLLPDWCMCYSFQPPGRGKHLASEPIDDMERMVDITSLQVSELLVEGTPFVFFGHSLGAWVAYETAYRLYTDLGIFPEHLFISAAKAPSRLNSTSIIRGMDTQGLLDYCSSVEEIPIKIRRNHAILRIYIPMLKADYIIAEEYSRDSLSELPVNLSVLLGTNDSTITDDDATEWYAISSNHSNKQLLFFEGDHLFINTSQAAIAKNLLRIINSL